MASPTPTGDFLPLLRLFLFARRQLADDFLLPRRSLECLVVRAGKFYWENVPVTGRQRRRLLFISAPQSTPPQPLQSPKGQRLIAGDGPFDKRGRRAPERSALMNSDGRDRFSGERSAAHAFQRGNSIKGRPDSPAARHAFTLATVNGEAAAPEGAEEESQD